LPPDIDDGLISVIVVNWNRSNLLRACLESLTAQRGVRFEILVVDNGSTDGSADMAKTCFAGGELPVTILENSTNLGFCAANNQGIAHTRGAYIALLNNDAEADAGWLAALAGTLDGHPEAGMAASKILSWEDPRVIDKAGHLIYLDGQNRGRGHGQRDEGQFDNVEEVLWPDGCAAMYRRSMIDEIGGFDEDFFAYADDAELGLRARMAGWTCIYVPHAVVRHHHSSTLGVQSARRLELIERNRVLLAVKHFPWSLLWLNGVFYLARLAAGAWAALRGRGDTRHFPGLRGKLTLAATLLKADLAALRMAPAMMRKRRRLRPLRRLSSREIRRLLWRYRITLRELQEQSL
jgi:GT2 family glycosyltransferase